MDFKDSGLRVHRIEYPSWTVTLKKENLISQLQYDMLFILIFYNIMF